MFSFNDLSTQIAFNLANEVDDFQQRQNVAAISAISNSLKILNLLTTINSLSSKHE